MLLSALTKFSIMKRFIIKFRIAFHSFYSILFNKDHIYSGGKFNSVIGTRNDLAKRLNEIIDLTNDEIRQSNILNDAKELLKV